MSIVEFLSQPLWQRLGLTLVHFLWQGLAVAVLVGVLVRVLRLNHGNARYAVYLLAFIAMMVCPVVTFTAIDTPISPNSGFVTGAEFAEVVDSSSYTALSAGDILPESENSSPAMPRSADSIPLGQRISDWLNVSMPWVLVIWMVGVIVLSVRLLMGFVGVYRWRHHLEPLPERLAQRIASLSEGLGMRGFSGVFISPTVLQAMAVGYLRPMVLLPAAMVTQMQPEMLEAVIAHELAHIRRLDLWVNLAQRVTETLLFYHPAVWWLSICLRNERELCCDELAVKATGERITYATTLESVGRARFTAKRPVLAAGLGHDDKPTLGRVRHILGLAPTQRNCPFWLAGVIAVLFLAAIAIPTTFALRNQSDEKVNDLESVVVVGARSMSESEILTALKTSDRLCEADFSASGTGMVSLSMTSPSETLTPTEWSITKMGDTWVLKEEVVRMPVPSVEVMLAENAGITTTGPPPSACFTNTRLVYIAPDICAICTGNVIFEMRTDQAIAKREEQMNVVHIFRLDDRPMMPLNYVMWSMGRGHSIYIEKIKSVSNHGEGTVKCECVSKVLGFPEQCELVIDTANAHLVRSAKYFIGGRAVLAVSTTGTRWENDRCLPESAVISELFNGREMQMPFVCRSLGTDPNRELIKRARDAVYGPYPVLTNVIDQRMMPWHHSVVEAGESYFDPREAGRVMSSQELVSEIRAREKRLLNLQVSSALWVEQRKSGGSKWERTPVQLSCTAWYDGLTGGKVRVDVDKEVLEWKDGAAPFSESSYSVAFDGQYGRSAFHKEGPLGDMAGYRSGVISPDVPPQLRTKWTSRATGVAFSTFFFYNEESKKFSDVLAEAISSENGKTTISRELLQQANCIRITYGDASAGQESFWLDPDRGFALIGHEHVNVTKDGRKLVVASDRVTKLTEAAPGIWFPTEAYHEWTPIPSRGETYETRMHYVASAVTANDSTFDESIFTLTFPPGYRIRDKTSRR